MNEMTPQECAEHFENTVHALHLINGDKNDIAILKYAAATMRKLAAGELVEVVHGRWEEERDPYGKLVGWNHKECGRMTQEATRFCPSCGALMDGGNNNAE